MECQSSNPSQSREGDVGQFYRDNHTCSSYVPLGGKEQRDTACHVLQSEEEPPVVNTESRNNKYLLGVTSENVFALCISLRILHVLTT